MNNKKVAPRIIPHSIEAEQAILGCLMLDEDVPVSVMGELDSSDFYVENHKLIYECMQTIYRNNSPIDFVTLTDILEKKSILDQVGGIDYITTLTNIVPSAANSKYYVDIVKRDSILRKLISAGERIVENSYESQDMENAITFAEKEVYDISQQEEKSSLEQIAPAVSGVINKFDAIAKDKNALRGLSTGFIAFDNITNGLQKSDLILLAARPGVGKTSFAMNIVNHVAIEEGKNCAIFSLEMPRSQIAQRSICSIAKISMEKALKGELSVDNWKALWSAEKKLTNANIYIDDSSMNTPIDILSKCRRLKREKGLDLVMIDYLQLMNGMTKSKDGNRQQEISEITRYLKIAARELDCPIILLSQLSRAVETRKDHIPQLSDLRESGSIEQDADIVLFIYKPDMYNDVVNEDEPGTCQLLIAKHRNGQLGNVKLRWIGEYTTFANYEKDIKNKQIEDNAPPENVEGTFQNFDYKDIEEDLNNIFN